MIPSRRFTDSPSCSCHSCASKHDYCHHRFFASDASAAEWSASAASASAGAGGGLLFPPTPLKREMTMRREMVLESSPCAAAAAAAAAADRAAFWRWPRPMPRCQPDNQIALLKWFLIRLDESDSAPGSSQVALGGFLYGMDSQFVKTGPIADRTDKTRVRTSDGVEVRLMGCIDEETTIANGFSTWVVDIFYSGFPCTWKRVLQDDTEVVKIAKKVSDAKRTSGENASVAVSENQAASQVSGHEDSAAQTRKSSPTVVCDAAEPIVVVTSAEVSQAANPEAATETDDVPAAESVADGAEAILEQLFGAETEQGTKTPEQQKEVPRKEIAVEPEHIPAPEEQPDVEDQPVATDPGNATGSVPVTATTAAAATTSHQATSHQEESNDDNSVEELKVAKPTQSKRGRKRRISKPAKPLKPVKPPGGKRGRPKKNRNIEQEVLNPPPTMENKDKDQSEKENEKQVEKQNEKQAEKQNEKQAEKQNEEQAEKQNEEQAEKQNEKQAEKQNKQAEKQNEEENVKETELQAAKRTELERLVADIVAQDNAKEQVLQLVSGADRQIEAERSTAQSKTRQRRRRRSYNMPPPLPASRVKQNEVIEAYGLKTSRSGRLLVPPLAYWRNQTIAHDKDGGVIAILDGFKETPSDTGCFNFKPPTGKKRLQQKLCAAAWEVGNTKKRARKQQQEQPPQQQQQQLQQQNQQEQQQQQLQQQNQQLQQ